MAVKDNRGKTTVKSMTKYNRQYRALQVAVKDRNLKEMQWNLVQMLVDDIKLQELGKNNTFKDLVRMVGRLGSAKPDDDGGEAEEKADAAELAEWAGVDDELGTSGPVVDTDDEPADDVDDELGEDDEVEGSDEEDEDE
jgi:hypothetical protein